MATVATGLGALNEGSMPVKMRNGYSVTGGLKQRELTIWQDKSRAVGIERRQIMTWRGKIPEFSHLVQFFP